MSGIRICHLVAVDRIRTGRLLPDQAVRVTAPACIRFEPAFVFRDEPVEVRWLSEAGDLLSSEEIWVTRDSIAMFCAMPFTAPDQALSCRISGSGRILAEARLRLDGAPATSMASRAFAAERRRDYYRTYEEVTELPFEDMLILARTALERSSARLTAVTGSVGKTSTKELIAHLSAPDTTYFSTDSWNFTHDACAQIVLNTEWARHFVFEMAVGYHLPDVGRLLPPDILVFTELGLVHIARFSDEDEIGRMKASLAAHMGPDASIVWNADRPAIGEFIRQAIPTDREIRLIRYSASEGRDADVVASRSDGNCLRIHDRRRGRTIEVEMPDRVTTHPANIAAAYCVSRIRDPGYDRLGKDMASFEPPPRRLELSRCGRLTLLNDGYNANPVSMKEFVALLKRYGRDGLRVGAVIGEMADLGDATLAEHRKLADSVKGEFGRLILVGPTYGRLRKAPDSGTRLAADAGALIESAWLQELVDECDVVGVKGSFCTNMESVVSAIESIAT